MTTAWIVTATPEASTLLALARKAADRVVAVTVGLDSFAGADAVVSLPLVPDTPVEAVAPGVAEAVAARPGDLVFVPDRPEERSLAGTLASRLRAPVLTRVVDVGPDGIDVVRHGLARVRVRTDGAAVLVADGGPAVAGASGAGSPASAPATHHATVTGRAEAPADRVDLAASARIVAVGRGVTQADLPWVRAFADALGADLACSRPVADAGWLPHDRYVGASGLHVAPELYVALGISGQLQHLSGVTGARTIVAVNTDPHAPIFALADHGIVGDVREVMPVLTRALVR